MSEGELHARLVRALLSEMRGLGDSNTLLVSADVTGELGAPRPPTLQSVRPDIFLRHRVTSQAWIGEAKSTLDVDTTRTRFQFQRYFEYLSTTSDGTLYVAVPMQCAGEAFRVAKSVRQSANCLYIPFVVTGWVLGTRSTMQAWRG
jgi:hypothetical protein